LAEHFYKCATLDDDADVFIGGSVAFVFELLERLDRIDKRDPIAA